MKLLPHSNGVHRVNMKKERTPQEKAKLVAMIIIAILMAGLLFQVVRNFIAKETVKQNVDYTVVNNKRMDYRLDGEGQYTLVFDGAIGTNLECWDSIINKLDPKQVSTFVYNRRGYGFSDGGNKQTPEDQAKDLKILLRKAGASEPYILVGEEYGSLVLSSFAKEFPDSVAGVVFLDPLKDTDLGSKAFKKSNFVTKLRRGIENFGASFGVTTLLDTVGLDIHMNEFTNALTTDQLHQFKIQRTSKKYTAAVYNELTSIYKGVSGIQEDGMFKDKPFFMLNKDGDTALATLGDPSVTKTAKSNSTSGQLAVTDSDNAVTGINYVLKILEDRAKANKKVN